MKVLKMALYVYQSFASQHQYQKMIEALNFIGILWSFA